MDRPGATNPRLKASQFRNRSARGLMRLEQTRPPASAKTGKVECLRDKQGRCIGKVVEAVAERLVGRGAATVLLVRPQPRVILA